jgi:hypothetical protein
LLQGQAGTTTTLTSVTPAAPLFGQTVTLTATVSPASASGFVSFMDKGALVASAKLNASGIAQATTLTLPAGPHALIAVYGGSTGPGYASSQSTALPYIVSAISGSGFASPVSYAAGTESASVAVGDFNGDGEADLAIADNGGSSISVLLGSGAGAFKAPVSYTVGTQPVSIAIADFNGDGKSDLAVADQGGAGVSVLLGKGDGTFQPAATFPAGVQPTSVAAGDFNGDGYADLAVPNGSGNNVSVLLGNGNGTFQTAKNYSAGTNPASAAVWDFNSDGKPDLVVTNQSSGNVSVLLGNGDGTFHTSVNYGAGTGPASVKVGDFNGDGNADLAVGDILGGTAGVLLGNGDGTFQAVVTYPAGASPISVALGDFNGDGKTDLALANASGGNVYMLLGNGNGTFQAGVVYGVGTAPASVATGDFNADGITDLAVANQGGGGVSILLGTVPPATSLGLVSSSNPSEYGQPITLTATVFPSTATGAVEFLDGTTVLEAKPLNLGQAQIYTSLLPSGSNSLSAVYNGAPGVWKASVSNTVKQAENPVAANGFAPALGYPGGSGFAVGDFNNDGKPDLAVVNDGSNNVSILLGNGDGTFQGAMNFPTEAGPSFVVAADFNGDGKSDLAIVYSGSNNISVLLGNGDGTFLVPVNYAAGASPSYAAVGDFNRDGKADLVIVNNGSGVSVLLGSGDGTLQGPQSYAVENYPIAVVVGDFNGDGDPDLVVSAELGNVSVLLGNGNGTFQTAVNYSVAEFLLGLTVGDFNGDGKLDVAVAGEGGVSVLLGNGDGTFKAAVNYSVGGESQSVAVGDFNGDGKLDLAASTGFSGISLLMGNGDGTFQPAVNVAGYDQFVAVGDFNGDGSADLVTGESILLGDTATSMTANSGTTPQSARILNAFATALAVTLTDASSKPVAGVNVTFTAPPTGATGLFNNTTPTITVATNSSGIATAPFFAANGTVGGPYLVTAAVPGLTTVNFSLTNTATAPGTMTANPGTTPQSAPINTAFFTAPSVTVTNPSNNPVAGVNVTFTAPFSGASGLFSGSTTTIVVPTNSLGVASAPFVANSTAGGPYTVTAAAPGLNTVYFSLTNTVGSPSSIMANPGTTPQSAPVGSAFPTALAVTVKDAGSNPVPGVNVTFTAPSTGASGLFGNSSTTIVAATNSSGIASAAFVANSTAGGPYTVTASALGLSAVNFSLTNTAGIPSTMTSDTGPSPLATAVNSAFSTPPAVLVKSSGGTPVAGVSVTFTAPSSGASGTFSNSTTTITVATNSSGVAVAPFTANSIYGTYTVTATAAGLTGVSFTLTNLALSGSMIVNAGTTPQSTSVNTPFAVAPAVTVTDSTGIPVAGLMVTFTAPGSGPSGVFSNSTTNIMVTTNSSGVASAPFTANGMVGGPYTVIAAAVSAATGALEAKFSLTNTASVDVPSPVSVSPGSGAGLTQTFTFSFADPAGFADLSVLDILINNYLDGIGACYVALVPASSSSGYLYLVDNAGDGGYVSGTPMLLPSSGSLANGQCTINGTGSSISGSGNTLTVTLNITFTPAFAGNKIFYMAARSPTQNSGWQALGTWNVPGPEVVGPAVGSVAPGRSVSTGQIYTFTFTDTSGYSDLAVLDVLTNSFLDGISACYVAYVPTGATTGYLYLVDDAGDGGYAAGSPILLSSGGTLQNSQCTINTATSSASASGNTLNLNLGITFSSSFAGNQVFYLAARNNSTGNSGWQAAGSVTVP